MAKKEIDRTPANLEAEKNLLGAVLLDNRSLDELFFLSDGDFFFSAHREIYRSMNAMLSNNEPISLVTLDDKLRSSGKLDAVGGTGYVASLVDGLPRSSNVESLAKIIKDKSIQRQMLSISELTQQLIYEPNSSTQEILDQVLNSFLALSMSKGIAWDKLTGKTALQAAVSMMGSLESGTALRAFTGITKIDKLTGGFRSGELVTITAGTGVGKSLLAQQIKRTACKAGLHGLYFSAEMTAEQLSSREVASEAGVEQWKMRRPERLSKEDIEALLNVTKDECKSCVTIDGDLSTRDLRLAARRKKSSGELKWLVIDYDELIEAPGKDEFAQMRAVAKDAKLLATFFGIPVFLISQLRKPLDKREAKMPTLERIYGGAAKVKHSSFVLFIDREYVQDMKGDETKARIVVLKSRYGKVGPVSVYFNIKTLRFEDELNPERQESEES